MWRGNGRVVDCLTNLSHLANLHEMHILSVSPVWIFVLFKFIRGFNGSQRSLYGKDLLIIMCVLSYHLESNTLNKRILFPRFYCSATFFSSQDKAQFLWKTSAGLKNDWARNMSHMNRTYSRWKSNIFSMTLNEITSLYRNCRCWGHTHKKLYLFAFKYLLITTIKIDDELLPEEN